MSSFINEAFGIVGLIIFAICLIIVGPLITIWSLDTLFPVLDIPMNFQTWAAVIGLGSFFSAKVAK